MDAGAGLLAASPAPQPLQEQDANHQPLLLSPSPLKAAAPVQPTLHEQARPWHAKGTGRRPVRRSFHLDSSQLVQAAVELLTDDRGEQAAEAAALLHAAAASLMNSQQWGQQLLAGAGTPVASGGGMRSPLLAGIGTPASLRRGAALLLAGSPLQPQQLMRDSAQQAAPHQQSVTPLLLQVQMQLAAGAAGSTLSNRSRRSSTSRMATPHAAASDGLRSALSYPFTPVEGIPERSFARQPPATVLRTATPGAVAFTPLEGVPETQRGFARTPAAPRFAFTPMEGVPEKASLGITPVVRPMRLAHATFAATAAAPLAAAAALMLHRDDFDDDDDGGDYCDGGEGGQPYVAGEALSRGARVHVGANTGVSGQEAVCACLGRSQQGSTLLVIAACLPPFLPAPALAMRLPTQPPRHALLPLQAALQMTACRPPPTCCASTWRAAQPGHRSPRSSQALRGRSSRRRAWRGPGLTQRCSSHHGQSRTANLPAQRHRWMWVVMAL